jgi:hypothetical protein
VLDVVGNFSTDISPSDESTSGVMVEPLPELGLYLHDLGMAPSLLVEDSVDSSPVLVPGEGTGSVGVISSEESSPLSEYDLLVHSPELGSDSGHLVVVSSEGSVFVMVSSELSIFMMVVSGSGQGEESSEFEHYLFNNYRFVNHEPLNTFNF